MPRLGASTAGEWRSVRRGRGLSLRRRWNLVERGHPVEKGCDVVRWGRERRRRRRRACELWEGVVRACETLEWEVAEDASREEGEAVGLARQRMGCLAGELVLGRSRFVGRGTAMACGSGAAVEGRDLHPLLPQQVEERLGSPENARSAGSSRVRHPPPSPLSAPPALRSLHRAGVRTGSAAE